MAPNMKSFTRGNREYVMVDIPNANIFQIKFVSKMGTNIETLYKKKTGREIFGMSHLVEHLSFRKCRDFTSDELMDNLRTFGEYNASTWYDQVDYYFNTTTTNMDLAIKMMANVTYNDLSQIPAEEFETERDVVVNEINRYMDDVQGTFYRDSYSTAYQRETNDNVLGSAEVVSKFELQDCVQLKRIFINNAPMKILVTYDSTRTNPDVIMDRTEQMIATFEHEPPVQNITLEEYEAAKTKINIGDIVLPVESDQSLTSMFIPYDKSNIGLASAVWYLREMAPDTSLNNYIREQNGLTYGVSFYNDKLMGERFVVFSCDVAKGNEQKLHDLFVKSINDSVAAYDESLHEKLVTRMEFQIAKKALNQNNLIGMTTYFSGDFEELKETEFFNIASKNLYDADQYVTDLSMDFETVKSHLLNLQEKINTKQYCLVSNYEK